MYYNVLGEKVSENNFISSGGRTCKMDRNKAVMRKFKNTTLLRNDGALFLASNKIHLHTYFTSFCSICGSLN